MTRRQHQQWRQSGGTVTQQAMRGEQLFVLARMGTAGHPQAPVSQALLAQSHRLLQQIGWQGQIELQVAGHLHPIGGSTQLDKTLRVSGGLSCDQRQATQAALHQTQRETAIAALRAGRQPRADHSDGQATASAGAQQIGPQLGL